MKTFIQPGQTVTLPAPYDVASGACLKVGAIVGVAANDATAGVALEVMLTGVHDLAKAPSQAWTVGAKIYWDDASKVTTTTATSNTLIGVAMAAVAGGASDTIGRVRLNGAFW
jgi:predicted RecA/RadA family phage recombinase